MIIVAVKHFAISRKTPIRDSLKVFHCSHFCKKFAKVFRLTGFQIEDLEQLLPNKAMCIATKLCTIY